MDKFTAAYAKMLRGMNARKLISESLEAPDAGTEEVLKANGFTPGRTLRDYGEGRNLTGWTRPLQDGKSLFIGYDNVDECVYAYITDIIDANDADAAKHHKCLYGPRDYSGMFTSYEDAISELGSITGEDAWSVYDSDLTDWFQEDDDADWNLSQDDYDKAYQIFADMAKGPTIVKEEIDRTAEDDAIREMMVKCGFEDVWKERYMLHYSLNDELSLDLDNDGKQYIFMITWKDRADLSPRDDPDWYLDLHDENGNRKWWTLSEAVNALGSINGGHGADPAWVEKYYTKDELYPKAFRGLKPADLGSLEIAKAHNVIKFVADSLKAHRNRI